MFGADGISVDVICYICVKAGPIYCLSCLCLHLLHPLVSSMQVRKGTVEEFWGNVDTATLEEEASLYRKLIPGTTEMLGYPLDLLPAIQLAP